jgi:undecaprenyl-diphosphatase
VSLDVDLLVWVGRRRRPRLDPLVARFSALGDNGHGWVVLAAALAALRGDLRLLVVAAATVWGTLAVNSAVKRVVRRPRPAGDAVAATLVRTPASHSFPSAHAAMSAAAAVVLTALVPRLAPAVVPLAVLMAGSRLYLAVHYPSDVLAGVLLGTGLGLAVVAAAV